MEKRRPQTPSGRAPERSSRESAIALPRAPREAAPTDADAELAGQERVFDGVLAGVELVLEADGVAFWRAESDDRLVLLAARSMSKELLGALDRQIVPPLRSIMERWPDSPLVSIPLEDPSNPMAEDIRAVVEGEGVVGLAGIPCRVPGSMLGLVCVVHRHPHAWTVRELGLATGFAGQLATTLENSRLFASVRSLAGRLEAIHELSLRLAQLRDAASVAQEMVAQVNRLVDCESARFYRKDGRTGTLTAVATAGPTGDAFGHSPIDRDAAEERLALVVRRNEALVVPGSNGEGTAGGPLRPGSQLLVPLAYGDEVQGVLVVSKAGGEAYSPQDEQALSVFARYAAQAIVNAGNIARLERQRALLEKQLSGERTLLGVGERLVTTLDPSRVLEQIAVTIGTVVAHDLLTIYRRDRRSGVVEPVMCRTGRGEAATAEPSPLDRQATDFVFSSGNAICVNGVPRGRLATVMETALPIEPDETIADGPAAGERGRGGPVCENLVVVPLRVRGEVAAALSLKRLGDRAEFTAPEFELSKLFGGQASLALQNAEAHFTVATRADLDSLTGLRNHGSFQRDLAALTEAGDPFSLVMMDLDWFKTFNDTYGHPAGDEMLKTVAETVVRAVRQRDRAYRYGGDEFALLLLGATPSQAVAAAARIGAAVQGCLRRTRVGPDGPQFGASVGVAHWPADGPGKTDLVKAADAALYEAKVRRGQMQAAAGESPAIESDALLGAARELLGAVSLQGVAAATLRYASTIVGSGDGMVALLAEDDEGRTRRARKSASLRPLAALGRFEGRDSPIRRREGFWGRLWAGGGMLTEDEGADGVLVGTAIACGGRVLGVVGFVLPAGKVPSGERLHMLDHLAALAGAAVERFTEGGVEGQANEA